MDKKEEFVLALKGKEYQGTLTNWYWQGRNLCGKYKRTDKWVIYDSQYVEQIIDDRILVLKEIEGYVLLENKSKC